MKTTKFKKAKSGLYVVLEGIDTSGKSTQARLLQEYYSNAGVNYDVCFTNEPYFKVFRNLIFDNSLPLAKNAEEFIFLADRAQHFEKLIIPSLQANKLVISDRSLISGIAYARDLENSLELNYIATHGLVPHLCVFISIDEATLRARLTQKSNDIIEKRGIAYLLKIQNKIKGVANMLECEILELENSGCDEENIQLINQKIISKIEELYAR